MIEYTDKTLMPFGQYKGTALANVPAKYLLYCLSDMTNLSAPLKAYIEENKALLEKEAKRTNRYLSR